MIIEATVQALSLHFDRIIECFVTLRMGWARPRTCGTSCSATSQKQIVINDEAKTNS